MPSLVRAVLRRLVPAALSLALLIPAALPAAAQSARDVYTVAGVPIDATAASAPVARDQAIAQGQRRALRLLMERLVLRRDYPRLPQVPPNDVVGMVDSFQVSGERTSAVRYAADLTVIFKPAAVRNLMAQAGIPIAETPSGLTLVLPVWRSPQGLQLFEDTNPWREAWIRIATGKGLVPLIMALGDTADLALINAEQAANGNANALAAIAQHYNVGQVIVAVASGDGRGESIDQLVVTLYVTGGSRNLVNVTPRRPPEALLATALAISQEVEESWKATIVSSGPVAGPPGAPATGTPSSAGPAGPAPGADVAGGPTLSAAVPVRQLADWLAIRNKLNQVSLIKKIDVGSLGVDGAQIVLSYVGGEQQLVAALAQVDLVLANEGGGWVLRARGGSTGPAPPAAAAPAGPGAAPAAAPSGAPAPPAAAPPLARPAPVQGNAAPPASDVPPVTAVPTTIGPAPGTAPSATPGAAPTPFR